MRVGYADVFLDDDTVTPGDTVYGPVWMQVITEGLTVFQRGPYFNSPFTYQGQKDDGTIYKPTVEVRHNIKGRINKWESYNQITNAAGE